MKYKLTINPDGPRPAYMDKWYNPGDPTEYIFEDGRYNSDFDLVPDGLPQAFIEKVYECLECVYHDYHNRFFGKEAADAQADILISKPMGLQRSTIEKYGWKFDRFTP